jgi:hypothetical protein
VATPTGGPAVEQNIVETAAADPRFTTLVSLAKRAGLADDLAGESRLTLFAPTNAAFRKVPEATRSSVATGPCCGGCSSTTSSPRTSRPSRSCGCGRCEPSPGPKVRIRVRDDTVFLSRRAKVVKTDISASNGTIHAIDRVLLPPAPLAGDRAASAGGQPPDAALQRHPPPVRIWDLEPALLCDRHLLGEHRELHAIWAIVNTGKRGYAHHPETLRRRDRLAALYVCHDAQVAEMTRRGFRRAGSIPD